MIELLKLKENFYLKNRFYKSANYIDKNVN